VGYLIEKDEGTAARRRVPMRLFTSNGTSPDTGASNDSVILAINSATTFVPDAVVTAIHAAQGMYYVELSASNVSVLGTHPLYHTQGDFSQHVATIQVVNANPFSTQSNFDLSNLTVKAVNSSVTIANADYSAVTVRVGGIAPATYSGVTVGINNIAAGSYSGVTVGAGNIAPGTYSGVTVGINNMADNTITAAAAAADFTTEVTSGLATTAQLNSGVTVASITAGSIVAATFGAGAVDAAALATDAANEIADAFLNRDMATGTDSGTSVIRTPRQALRAIRNKASIAAGILTVTKENDTTSSWTAEVTTAAGNPISSIDPQ
jgi:hypothetical protein